MKEPNLRQVKIYHLISKQHSLSFKNIKVLFRNRKKTGIEGTSWLQSNKDLQSDCLLILNCSTC